MRQIERSREPISLERTIYERTTPPDQIHPSCINKPIRRIISSNFSMRVDNNILASIRKTFANTGLFRYSDYQLRSFLIKAARLGRSVYPNMSDDIATKIASVTKACVKYMLYKELVLLIDKNCIIGVIPYDATHWKKHNATT